jgi:hypothetical protein
LGGCYLTHELPDLLGRLILLRICVTPRLKHLNEKLDRIAVVAGRRGRQQALKLANVFVVTTGWHFLIIGLYHTVS